MERLKPTINSSRLRGKLSSTTKVSIFGSCLLRLGLSGNRYYENGEILVSDGAGVQFLDRGGSIEIRDEFIRWLIVCFRESKAE